MISELATETVDFGGRCSNERSGTVTKITIHHMAAVIANPMACAKMHKQAGNASANYYIGNTGTICAGIPEERRAWTSSSRENDQQAITIEVSNSAGEPDWPVSDAAYKAMIALCADICKRYGIRPEYNGTKNATLTEHRMFAATACPGPYLHGLLQSKKIQTDILAAMPTAQPLAPVQKDNAAAIWAYLMGKIGNPYGVAGLMGNLWAESGLRPDNLQNSFEKSLGYTDAGYTAAVDNGSYVNFVHDSAGYGLAQWTFHSRKQALLTFKQASGKSIGDLTMQLDFLYKELTEGYRGVLNGLKAARSVREASDVVLLQYERPADQSEAMKQRRAGYGTQYYNRFTGNMDNDTPYTARITADELNVRQGPGTGYQIVQTVRKGSAYTIMEVCDGWGRLKSGLGWVNLSYTERV